MLTRWSYSLIFLCMPIRGASTVLIYVNILSYWLSFVRLFLFFFVNILMSGLFVWHFLLLFYVNIVLPDAILVYALKNFDQNWCQTYIPFQTLANLSESNENKHKIQFNIILRFPLPHANFLLTVLSRHEFFFFRRLKCKFP